MTRKRDVKKSDFTTLESTEPGDYFDFTRSNQNYKIELTNLQASMGVSGELQTLGEATATPVLRIIAGVNYIRNVLGHRGISVATSPQDGIQIGHNFTVDTTGVPIMINEGADSPTIRSVEAGNGINVSGSGGIMQIALSEIPASSKTVIVYDINDFPDPDLIETDLIILEDDTEYKLQNDVSSVYRYQMGSNTLLSGADANMVNLEYTGTGTMLTISDVNCKIKDIRLICATGTLHEVSSTTGLHRFQHFDGNCICYDMGTVDNMRLVYFDNVNYQVENNGVVFSGNIYTCILNLVAIYIAGGTGNAIDLGTAVFDIFQLNQAFANVNSTGYAVTGALDSANIAVDGLGTIENSRQFGTADSLNNISPFDDRWEMTHNANVPNSMSVMLATNAGVTVDLGTTNPNIIGATWLTHTDHRFDTVIGGRWTYTGKGMDAAITATISADLALATDNISFYIYKNGTQITESRVTREFTAGNPGNVSIIWDEYLVTGDYLELWVSNDDTNVDMDILNATMRIKG